MTDKQRVQKLRKSLREARAMIRAWKKNSGFWWKKGAGFK